MPLAAVRRTAVETLSWQGSDGYRGFHTDRQQWLADLDHVAAIYAEFRSQPRDRAARRALRARLRAVDDQVEGFRRQERVLGPQSGILHLDGRAGGGDGTNQALRVGGGADHSAGDRGADGGAHRLDLAWAVRGQHRLRLGQGRV